MASILLFLPCLDLLEGSSRKTAFNVKIGEKMKRQYQILIGIVILGAGLRFWGLGKNPPGMYWDEVSLGWNAYSILKTGHDEHGRFLPLDTFFAFGDYKPPGYIYAAIPSIALFGLNELAVRFPSALAGTLLIVVTWFLVGTLLRSEPAQRGRTFSEKTALLAALLVAISPWSVTLSRVGFEANLAVLFHALGGLFFLYAVRRNHRWLPVSVVSFVLAAYTFNANRMLSPLFLAGLTLIFFRVALKNWKTWAVSGILGILLVLPMVGHLRSPEGGLRWREVNIFSDPQVIETSNARRARAGNSLWARLIHHRYLGFAGIFLRHYFDHFDLNYLFLDGDPNPRISLPDMGQLYLIELPFLLIGGIWMVREIRENKRNRELLVLLLWLLLAAVPAGMARETPHALRSASTLPVPQVLTALGAAVVAGGIKSIKGRFRKEFDLRKFLLFAICCLLFASLAGFQLIYWRYYPHEWAGEWLTSYKSLVQQVQQVQDEYQTIYLTPDLGRPYVYFLFYNQYDPQSYIDEAQAGGRTGDAFGFFEVRSVGKYRFFVPDLSRVSADELVVTRADPAPEGFESLKVITDTNGHPQFRVIRRI